MAKIITIIVLLGILIFLLYSIIVILKTNSKIKEYFKSGNVIVFGSKGKGKDLLFQKHILMNKKKHYLANISYGYNCQIYPIDKLSVKPNTYDEMINDKIVKIDKNNDIEGLDYYLSDGGNYLPCQYDYLLHKKYPSFPIYYSLSRHLYNQNIHINTQNLTRIWKALREQADKFIRANGVINLPFFLICKVRFYEKYESAVNNLLPLKSRLLNKYSKAEADQYYATHGEIYNGFYIISKRKIKYDTRYFETVFFNNESIERRMNK